MNCHGCKKRITFRHWLEFGHICAECLRKRMRPVPTGGTSETD